MSNTRKKDGEPRANDSRRAASGESRSADPANREAGEVKRAPSEKRRAASGKGRGTSEVRRGSDASSKRRGRKGILHSGFYRFYFVLVIVCLAGIGYGLYYLDGLLADYEIAQPIYTAEAAARLFEDEDYASLYDYDTSAAELGDRNFYVQRMRELASGKEVSYSAGYTTNAGQRVYNVKLDGDRFAQLTLVPSERVTDHGNRFWKLGSVTTFVALATPEPTVAPTPTPVPTPEPPKGFPHRITVPSDSTVVAEGIPLTAEDVVTTGIETDAAKLLPEGVESPTLTEYEFYSESETPDIQVTDKFGNPQTVEAKEPRTWACGLCNDLELQAQFEEDVIDVAKRLASLPARKATKGNTIWICASNSPAWEKVMQYDTALSYSGTRDQFENVVASQFYKYSDDCFSCHVSFDYVSTFGDGTTHTYATAFTLYFINQNGKGKLYNFSIY